MVQLRVYVQLINTHTHFFLCFSVLWRSGRPYAESQNQQQTTRNSTVRCKRLWGMLPFYHESAEPTCSYIPHGIFFLLRPVLTAYVPRWNEAGSRNCGGGGNAAILSYHGQMSSVPHCWFNHERELFSGCFVQQSKCRLELNNTRTVVLVRNILVRCRFWGLMCPLQSSDFSY